MNEETKAQPEINAPQVERRDDSRIVLATECAFGTLINTAKRYGPKLSPVMGLMYLPTEKLTADFQQACHAIIAALREQ